MGLLNKKEAEDVHIGKNFAEASEQDLHEEVDLSVAAGKAEIDEEELEERRAYRRSRRIRNEILAYSVTVLVLAAVSAGVFKGIQAVRTYFAEQAAVEESVAIEETEVIQDILESMLASESELPTEVEVVVSAEELFEEYLDTVIAGMTLEEKVYGLMITSPEELTGVNKATRAGSGTQTSLEAKPVGGLVYYRKNMESKEQFTEMLTNTASYSKFPIFLAVNEGGDSASSVQNSPITVPEVTKPGSIASAEEAFQLGSTIGSYLSELNFNVNFAPTADILHETNAANAGYCFGGDADLNAKLVMQYIAGLEEQGISSALKTFPGTGYLKDSTEKGSVSTERTRAEYEADFRVFKAGIDAGVDFVMVSHVVASELSGGMDPCSMSSSVVTDILRGELGFKGIVITEPMTNKAITEYYTPDESAVAALKAGCDMILLPEDLETAVKGILDGVSAGSVSEERINDSLKRVYRVKYAEKLAEFENE